MRTVRLLWPLAALLCVLLCQRTALGAPIATTTTLTVAPSGQIGAGGPVTLAATVVDANNAPISTGTVTFYDGKAPLGSSQIVTNGSAFPSGTANLKRILGVGSHSLTAAFNVTAANAASVSSAQTVTVGGNLATMSTISSTAGSTPGQVVLSGMVTANGPLAPTGSFNFVDQSNAGQVVATSNIGSATTHYQLSEQQTAFATPTSVTYVVADFNQDGIPDVAALNDSNQNMSTVTVFLGNGTVGSTQAPGAPLSIAAAYTLVAGDFNADGIPDLAISSESGSNGTMLYVFLGDGTGQFTAAAGSPYSLGNEPSASVQSMVVADFNGDGILDIAETEYPLSAATKLLDPEPTKNDLNILLGNGNGGFLRSPQSPLSVSIGNDNGVGEAELLAADFNNDGIPDLVASDAIGNKISVLFCFGNGTFSAPITTPTSSFAPESLAVGDFNGDGKIDIAAASDSGTANTLLLLLGDGAGNFTDSPSTPPGTNPPGGTLEKSQVYGVIGGDFNGDGHLDIATLVNGSLALFLGDGNGNLTPASGSPYPFTNPLSYTPAAADFNGDGTLDIAAISLGKAGNGPNTVQLVLNDASVTATANTQPLSIPGAGSHNVVATYSGDGIYVGSTSTAISVAGVASASPDYTVVAAPSSATIKRGQSATFTFAVTPSGGFSSPVSFSCGALPSEATCSFTPTSVTPGSGPATSVLTITTTAPTVSFNGQQQIDPWFNGSGKATSGICLAALILIYVPRRFRDRSWLTHVFVALICCGMLAGCGAVKKLINQNTDAGTPTGTSTITVTASSGAGGNATSHTAPITVVIQ